MATYRSPFLVSIINTVLFALGANCSQNDSRYNNSAASESNVNQIESLRKLNFLVGIAWETAIERNENESALEQTQCAQDMKTFLDGIESKQIWAMKMIDAFGNMPRSFIWGNNFWFSSPELCSDIHNPFRISLNSVGVDSKEFLLMNATSPFRTHLQMIYFSYSTPMQLDLQQQYKPFIQIGLCVPETCSQEYINDYSDRYFEKKLFNPQNWYGLDMSIVGSKLPAYDTSFFSNIGLLLLISLVLVFGSLIILAEVVHLLQNQQLNVNKTDKIQKLFGTASFENFVSCFSLRQNIPRVIQATASEDFVPVIAGLRTIVCCWVTLLHVFYHSMFVRSNIPFLYAKMESFILQPVIQACFYVDVFFTISGFLLAYNFLTSINQLEEIRANSLFENLKYYLKLILHRHFRLMPIFILTMILSDFFFGFIDMVSPFYLNEYNDLYCKETWWYNLLYINNAIPLELMCSSWGWYIACEMQFFVFFLAILFIYAKSQNTGKVVFATSAVVLLLISYYCYYINGVTFQIDVIGSTTENVYVKPWTRITPYFGGIFMGWLLCEVRGSEINFGKSKLRLYWTVAVILYLTTIFMSYWKETPVWIVAGIMSFGKLIFALFIGSLVCVCQLGYGGKFAEILRSKLFLFLHKFSFSMYMIAPIVISVLFGLRTEATQFNEMSSASDICAVFIISFVFAVSITLFVEIPFQRLSNSFVLKRCR